jgi:hypothetical protein
MTDVALRFQEGMDAWAPFGGWVPLGGFAFMFAAGLLVTLVHESGHLAAAVATRQTDIALAVGSRGTLIDRKLGSIQVTMRAITGTWGPSGSVSFDAARTTAVDMTLIAAAGPAASLAGAVVTGVLADALGPGIPARFLAVATVFGALVGLGNLIPFEVRDRRGQRWFESDGRQLAHAGKVLYELRGP